MKKIAAAIVVSGLIGISIAVPARAEESDTPQTLVAYSLTAEGSEYLQEGYVEKAAWQAEFEAQSQEIQQIHAELLDLRNYLSEENAAKVDNFSIDNFNYIEELQNVKDEFTTMRDEALAAKERQLEQQRQKEQQQSQPSNTQTVYSGNGSGLTQSSGVNYHGGRRETYYSSRVLYHYRTPEWTVDSEGFYRTAEGYYVVAASDMAQGTVFQGSKGMCQVLDSGCAAGTTDYYVSW